MVKVYFTQDLSFQFYKWYIDYILTIITRITSKLSLETLILIKEDFLFMMLYECRK